jgi:hypothetical protein
MSRMVRQARGLLPGVLVSVLIVLTPQQTLAQGTGSVQIEQAVSATYGVSLTFRAHAISQTPLNGARLTIQIANRDSLYSEAVPLTGGTEISVLHAISPGDIRLPPFALLTYYWDLQDENGQQYRSEPQIMRYEDTSVPWEWAVDKQGNIVVHSDGRDPEISRAALDIAGNALRDATRLVGTAVEEEIHVYVYPELVQMASSLRLHQLEVQDWVAAYALPEQRVVMVTAAPGPEVLVNLQRDLPHEITHIVVALAAGEHTDSVPGWFNEGLALMSAAEPDPTLYSTLEAAMSNGGRSLLSLETLCAPNFSSLPPRQAALAYAQSESTMRYISDRYGTSQVRALTSAYANGLSCEAGVEQALGLSLDELQKQWQSNLARTASRSPQKEGGLLPWLIVWAVSAGLALLFVAPQPYQPGEARPPAYTTKPYLPRVPDEPPGQSTGSRS